MNRAATTLARPLHVARLRRVLGLAVVMGLAVLGVGLAAGQALPWSAGPWLVLDERNVLAIDALQRVLGRPERMAKPMVDGATDGNFQPYFSVIQWRRTARPSGITACADGRRPGARRRAASP